MKNVHKNLFVWAIQLFVLGFVLFGNSNSVKAATASCIQATDCVSGQVCINGSCQLPAHAVAPDAPIVGSTGQIKSTVVPGITSPDRQSELIKCGRPGQNMCTLCNLIEGLNNIIQYLWKIAIGVALLAFTIGGVMYVVSAGDSGLIDSAKSVMKNAAIGFIVIFAAFLIINTTIDYIGSKKDANGNLTFGMNITSWGKFECAANQNR